MKFLRFPMLVMKDILRNMDPIVLINLSLLSKKMSILISFGDSSRFKISLGDYLTISCGLESYNIYLCRGKSNVVAVKCFGGMSSVNWNDTWPKLLFHILKVFKCPITTVTGFLLGPVKFKEAMQQVIRGNFEIQDMDLKNSSMESDVLGRMFEEANVTGTLTLNREYESTMQCPKNLKYLLSENSEWFTIDKLLTSRCVVIEVQKCSLTNFELDEYLRKWQNGDYPNLEYFFTSGMYLNDWSPILEMMPPINDIINTQIIEKKMGSINRAVLYGVKTQRADGVVAWVRMVQYWEPSGLVIMKFSMIVLN
ncbi:hypothetical protein GCK72_008023 [Caenorhabditis remanei]|uniref:F-box domain-containing protein n=1 Tax=Caenorhabditis remanei TaxID=31234 RepID=A0A6A5HQI1_CAERE|nr:hypothetical protein GCK72_008023 [Caenorhabditis remanei]KAF1768062.1 hypothetical protein GCK72_008023 [Caenorhabditis remanei]